MLLTMSASVQNDSLALLLGVAVIALALTRLGERPTPDWALLVGALAGLAILTKLTNWVVVVAVAGWILWIHRRSAVGPVLAFVGAAAAVCGWWFIRNVVLYGDLTSASAVERSGVSFDRYQLHGPGDVGHIVQQIVTYFWLPTEYLRNFISAPTMLKAAALIITVAVALLGGVALGGSIALRFYLLAAPRL